jgi:hypothetical protein
MDSNSYLKYVPSLKKLQTQYTEFTGSSDLHTTEWCEYLVEESKRLRTRIDKESGEFIGELYTFPNLKSILTKAFYPIWVKGDDRVDYKGFGDSKDYTSYLREAGFHRMNDSELFAYLSKHTTIIESLYEKYRNNVIQIIQNREKYDKEMKQIEKEKEERDKEFKKSIISKFVSTYSITDEEAEAVILHVSSQASKKIRQKYKGYTKNTLLALQFINKYSADHSIRFEDTLTVLLENI